MPQEQGILKIYAERGGTIGEITGFLCDLDAAYVALYQVNVRRADPSRLSTIARVEVMHALGYVLSPFEAGAQHTVRVVPPSDTLVVNRVSIESPGFWEVLGALNPLQQIREYLNDRHKRRQDRDFREAAEKDRLVLENELIRRQVFEKENSVLRDRILILRDLGYDNDEIDRFIWGSVGGPLSRLGKHQDSKLIGGGDGTDRDAA
jgi:hypothetical protein